MKRLLCILSTGLFLVISSTTLLAQAPQKFNYQTVVRNVSGNPIPNQVVSFRISILSASALGPVVYSETFSATTNTFGLASFQIGAGTPVSGTFSSISWGSNSYYIKTEVDPNGGTAWVTAGTEQLLSVPYALYSNSSGSTGSSLPTGTNGQTLRNNGSGWVANSNLYNDGTKIGIGTSTPTQQLDITKNINLAQSTATTGNIYKNTFLYMHNYGISNTFLGYNSGNLTLDIGNSGWNVGIGDQSLSNLQYGSGNVGIGYRAGFYNDNGSDNVQIGVLSLEGNYYGYDNVAIGNSSLRFCNYPVGLVAVGYKALEFNNSGEKNTAIGTLALNANTDGDNNTAVGDSALANNQGSCNTALGSMSLLKNYSGFGNTGIGYGSLYNNQSGQKNTAIGAFSSWNTTTGESNTSIGYYALMANTTGEYNSALGRTALAAATTGDYNAGFGADALFLVTTGSSNTAVGTSAGAFINTGNNNTAIGRACLTQCGSGSSNIAIGAKAAANGNGFSFTVAIGDSALFKMGTLGYGTTAIHNTGIGSKNMVNLTNGNSNTSVGFQAQYNTSSGSSNVSMGVYAMRNNQTGSRNIAIGTNSLYNMSSASFTTVVGANAGNVATSYNNSSCIGDGASITAANQIRVGDGGITSIGGYANWTNLSDGRFKTPVNQEVHGLDFIMKLKPVLYRLEVRKLADYLHPDDPAWKEKELAMAADIDAKEALINSGFIAQEVEQAAKEVGYDFSGVDKPKNANDLYGLRYAEFVVPLVKAVQEQQAMIQQQQEQIKALQTEIGFLKTR